MTLLRLFLLACSNNRNGEHQQHHTYAKRQNVVSGHTADKEAYKAYRRDHQRVRHLRGNVINVVALCTRGCEDGRIRNRRNVVAADRARQRCGNADGHDLRHIRAHRNDDRNQDADGAPRGAGGEAEAARNEEARF